MGTKYFVAMVFRDLWTESDQSRGAKGAKFTSESDQRSASFVEESDACTRRRRRATMDCPSWARDYRSIVGPVLLIRSILIIAFWVDLAEAQDAELVATENQMLNSSKMRTRCRNGCCCPLLRYLCR